MSRRKKRRYPFGGSRPRRALLPLGARSTVGCVAEGDDQVGVRVLDSHASWPQAHVDLVAFVYAAAMTIGVREPKAHATDPLPEAAQREAEPAFHTGANALPWRRSASFKLAWFSPSGSSTPKAIIRQLGSFSVSRR